LRRASLWLAQTAEDARRLVAMGARPEDVRVGGNLKYDVRAPTESTMNRRIGAMLIQARLILCGSTLPGEEEIILAAWPAIQRAVPDAVLLIAPRHPDRFGEVGALIRKSGHPFFQCSHLLLGTEPIFGGVILLLDTIGDLAAMYRLGSAAFVGGSLVKRGGHNPLEPAQFGVPVVMGPSFENFRDIVGKMQTANGIQLVQDKDGLELALVELLTDRDAAREMGERGRKVFEQQQGATQKAVDAVVEMIQAGTKV
jgi:3-deoxy-D-manno-octulosonic-acid transferase